MDFADVVRKRRMVRNFTDEPVSHEALERIIAAAQRAPSAGFSQGVVFVTVTNPETRATIGDLRQLLVRFIGEVRANAAFARFERESQRDLHDRGPADSDIVSYSERQLAGAIGASKDRRRNGGRHWPEAERSPPLAACQPSSPSGSRLR